MGSQTRTRIISKPQSVRGLQTAIDHVNRGWFPINDKVLELIRRRLKAGEYNENRQALISDLQADFALYTWLLKSLKELAFRQKIKKNSLELIREIDISEIYQILTSTDSEVSQHQMGGLRKEQAQRMKHTLISCGTAQILAKETDIDADLVYSCATLRQLGLNLVAFNYPHIYNKAMSSLESGGEDIESAIQRSLGFYPALLGYKTVLNGEISATVRRALNYQTSPDGESPPPVRDSTSGVSPDILMKLCDIGEAFARVSDPEHYPAASAEWESVVDQINSYLGPEGLTVLADKMEDSFGGYASLMPEIRKTISSPAQNARDASAQVGMKLFQANTFIPKCPADLQERFKRVYSYVLPDRASDQAIAALMGVVFPYTGFTRGCIYIVDQRTNALVPRLRVGDCTLSRYKTLNGSLVNPDGSPIVEALYCRVPIKQENVFLHGELVSHISGALGNADQVGVLYLEVAEALVETGSLTSLIYFRAVRQCLMDCMAIK